jgi:glutathione peroxidase
MSIYTYKIKDSHEAEKELKDYQGKVLLIVNTASHCGYTPQYAGLQSLYDNLQDVGLEILAFPCNQFGQQEPGTNAEIQEFCRVNYKVTFPVFAKIEVNGDGADPLYQYLTGQKPAEIKWNFTKFLVDKKGNVVERFEPNVVPEKLEPEILKLLFP